MVLIFPDTEIMKLLIVILSMMYGEFKRGNIHLQWSEIVTLLRIANMVLLSVVQMLPLKFHIPTSGKMNWGAVVTTKTAEGFPGFRWNSKALDSLNTILYLLICIIGIFPIRKILPVLIPVTQQRQTQMEVLGILEPAGMVLKQIPVTAMQMELRTS